MATKAETKKEQRKGRGSHPNSRANLKPSTPGMTNNPAGKPPGTKDRATVIRKWLDVELDLTNPITRKAERGTVEDEVVLALIAKARKGDVTAVREILDSRYGKAAQPITGKDGGPVTVETMVILPKADDANGD